MLFSSNRNAFKTSEQFELFTVFTGGAFPVPLLMPVAYRGTFSPVVQPELDLYLPAEETLS